MVAGTACGEAAVQEVPGMAVATPAMRLTVGTLLTMALVNTATATAQTPAEPPPAASPAEAVRQVVEARGTRYADYCAATRLPADRGAFCATFVAEQSGVRAYLIGRTFSEFSEWVFVAQQGGGWWVVGTAPLDFFDSRGHIP
jgi:hypothetical protein